MILNCAFGHKYIAVDTHVKRVSNRIGMVNSKNTDIISTQLEQIIPEKFKLHAHHWLILHGRYICKAKKPLCDDCPIHDFCLFIKDIN